MSIDEADALAMEERYALAEEDLSDEALETSDDLARSMTLIERAAAETTLTGDLVDAETGEVLKDAPGWKDGQIQNIDGLDWAGEKLSETCATIRENERLRDAAVERLQRRIDLLKARTTAINSPLVMRREFFEKAIAVFAEAHGAEVLRGLRKGAKSRTFPSGLKLAWRTEAKGGVYRWDEKMKPAEREACLLQWAHEEESMGMGVPNLTKDNPKPDLEAIKAYVASKPGRFGKPPPGLEYVPEHEELSIKVEGNK